MTPLVMCESAPSLSQRIGSGLFLSFCVVFVIFVVSIAFDISA